MSAFLYMARNWGLKVEKCKITLIAKLGKKINVLQDSKTHYKLSLYYYHLQKKVARHSL